MWWEVLCTCWKVPRNLVVASSLDMLPSILANYLKDLANYMYLPESSLNFQGSFLGMLDNAMNWLNTCLNLLLSSLNSLEIFLELRNSTLGKTS